MKLIGMGIIVNPNYIGTSLSGSIQEFKSKGKNPIQFLQIVLMQIKVIERLIGLAIQN